MTNKENFLPLVSEKDSGTIERNRKRIQNREVIRESQKIALKVLNKLGDLGWSQKDLAKAMNVTPQQITKIVSGKENLTLETQIKLQDILNIPILASYYEHKMSDLKIWTLTCEKKIDEIKDLPYENSPNYQSAKVLISERKKYSLEYYQELSI